MILILLIINGTIIMKKLDLLKTIIKFQDIILMHSIWLEMNKMLKEVTINIINNNNILDKIIKIENSLTKNKILQHLNQDINRSLKITLMMLEEDSIFQTSIKININQ